MEPHGAAEGTAKDCCSARPRRPKGRTQGFSPTRGLPTLWDTVTPPKPSGLFAPGWLPKQQAVAPNNPRGPAQVDKLLPITGECPQHTKIPHVFQARCSKPTKPSSALLQPQGNLLESKGGTPASQPAPNILAVSMQTAVAIPAGGRGRCVCTKRKAQGRHTAPARATSGGKETEKPKTHDVGLLFAPSTGHTQRYHGEEEEASGPTGTERCLGDGDVLTATPRHGHCAAQAPQQGRDSMDPKGILPWGAPQLPGPTLPPGKLLAG